MTITDEAGTWVYLEPGRALRWVKPAFVKERDVSFDTNGPHKTTILVFSADDIIPNYNGELNTDFKNYIGLLPPQSKNELLHHLFPSLALV